MAIEMVFNKLMAGQSLSLDEADLLWNECEALDLGSHIQGLPGQDQRSQGTLKIELEIPQTLAQRAKFLLETYNKIHRSANQVQDCSSWLHTLALELPINQNWRQAVRASRQWLDSDFKLRLKAYKLHEIKALCDTTGLTLNEILHELRTAGIQEIDSSPIRFHRDDSGLEQHIWFEMQHAVHHAGLSSSLTIDLDWPWEYFKKVLEISRNVQDEQAVFQRCCFISHARRIDQDQLDSYLKKVAISRCYLSTVRSFEMQVNSAFQPFLSLFNQLGVDSMRKKINFSSCQTDVPELQDGENNFYRAVWSQVLTEVRQNKRYCRIQLRQRSLGSSQMPALSSQQQVLPLLLYKADKGDSLSENEAMHMAYSTSIYTLGQCTLSIRQRRRQNTITFCPGPAQILSPIELVDKVRKYGPQGFHEQLAGSQLIVSFSPIEKQAEQDIRHFIEQLTKLNQHVPNFRFGLLGLKSFWQAAIREQIDLKQAARELHDLGLKMAYSSAEVTEQDLTHSEIRKIHGDLHEAGIPTIGKVEIVVPYTGDDGPFWDRFLQRLRVFKDLNKEYGQLRGIGVCLTPGCRINFSEYLRAIALTRIYLKDVPQTLLRSKLSEVELISSWHDLFSSASRLLVKYGIDDFGIMDSSETAEQKIIADQLQKEGYQFTERTFCQF